RLSRRQFAAATAGRAAGATLGPTLTSLSIGKPQAVPTPSPVKITDIEVHDITLEYEDWIAYELNHYYGPSHRTVYVVHTDTGLEGLGEGSHESAEVIKKYIGSNPFDWTGYETSLPLSQAT